MATVPFSADTLGIAPVKPAHEVLASALRRQIILGTFAVGTRLPTERDLAPALGVSRNTARQAIKLLADQGLVQTSLGRNGGSVVLDPPSPTRNRRAALLRWRTVADDSLQIRLATEPLAARWSCERGSAGQRRAIAKLAGTPITSLADYQDLETRLHVQLVAAARSDVLTDLITRCHEELFGDADSMWIRSALTLPGEEWADKLAGFAEEHRAIGDAVARADSTAAELAMRTHLESTARHFDDIFAQVLGEHHSSERSRKPAAPS